MKKTGVLFLLPATIYVRQRIHIIHSCWFSRPVLSLGHPAMSSSEAKQFSTSSRSMQIAEQPSEENPLWIFGYGSLIWKTNFPFSGKEVGHIKGFSRKFWQGSTDHRGIPGKPGRVATLIEDDQCITWGIAYQVLPASVPEVMAYLDHREKGGYTLHNVQFFPKNSTSLAFKVFVYIATENNEEFLGDAPVQEMAKQIATSHGPSGDNSEYLMQLAKAVREMGVTDDHLFELETRVTEELINNRISLLAEETCYPVDDVAFINRKALTAVKQESNGED